MRRGALRLLAAGFALSVLVPALGASATVQVPAAGHSHRAAPLACPTSPDYVVLNCHYNDPNNNIGMFAGGMVPYNGKWIAVYMKNWTNGSTTYHTGYTATSATSHPGSDWSSAARTWAPNGTDNRPGVIDPGIQVFGDDVVVATIPSQGYTSHSTNPGAEDSFVTPVAMPVCTGDIDPGCLSTEGNGVIAELSLLPVDVPVPRTVYAVYSFCPTSAGCSTSKKQEIHLRVVPDSLGGNQYVPWGPEVTCAKDSGWAKPSGKDNGHQQRAVVVTLAHAGGVGTKMACIYNQYQNGGARTIGMTTSSNGLTWSSSTTISKESGYDLHNPYAIQMNGNPDDIRVYYQRYDYNSHCTAATVRKWTLNYIETTDGGATWKRPLGTGCTGIAYPRSITSTSRPVFVQDGSGHVWCFSTWVDGTTLILGVFDTKT